MEMEVTGKPASSLAFCLLSPQVPASGPLNRLAACGAVPQACLWGWEGETQYPGPWGHPHPGLCQSSPGFRGCFQLKEGFAVKQLLKISALRDKSLSREVAFSSLYR